MRKFTKRQTDILNSAIKIIIREGFNSLTIKNLSTSLNITDPAIYRHFKNKNEILEALIDYFDNYSKSLFDNIDLKNYNPIERLKYCFMSRAKEVSQNEYMVIFILSEEFFNYSDLFINKYMNIRQENNKTLLNIIQDGQEQNFIRSDINCENILFIYISSMKSLFKKWFYTNRSFDLTVKSEEFINDFIKLVTNVT